MTTAAERSRAFIAGLELLQDLLDPKKTPRVPTPVRERASRVLRHFPTVSEIALATSEAHSPVPLPMPYFDPAELDRHLAARDAERLAGHREKAGL